MNKTKTLQKGSNVSIIAPDQDIVVTHYVHKKSSVAINVNAPAYLLDPIKSLVKEIKWKVKEINRETGKVLLECNKFIEKLQELKKNYQSNAKIFITKMIEWFSSNLFVCKIDYVQVV